MKTIGLIGGMSWESSIEYYRVINQEISRRLAGAGESPLHSAELILVSLDFAPIEAMQAAGDWDGLAEVIAQAAQRCETAGADFLVLCTNTMHRVLPRAERSVNTPFLHIADATASRIRAAGLKHVGLLGTRFTMEGAFYRGRLEERGLSVVTPPEKQMEIVHQIIYDELVRGIIREESRAEYRRIIAGLAEAGADSIIAGCTEIGLLVSQEDATVPLFDTARIHAEEAVARALAG